MSFVLADTIALLGRTPRTLRALLDGLPPRWTLTTDGPGTWSPDDIVAHLRFADETNWMVRARLLRAQSHTTALPAFDQHGHLTHGADRALDVRLADFALLRDRNLRELTSWQLGDAELAHTADHPTLGLVTLAELLSAWTAHDLAHLAQIARVMARRYRSAVGPWRVFLPIMDRP